MQFAGFGSKEKVDHLVSKDMMDRETRRQLHKFLEDVELTIYTANREVVQRMVPKLNRDNFTTFAVRVAEARANYVKTAMELATHADPSAADIARLKAARETNDELLHAFEAAHRLIERGYTDIG